MASGYGSWELDKREVNLDCCDVDLGLKLPWQQQQRQQQQQQSSVSWLQNPYSENNSRISSPRFGGGGGGEGRVAFTAGQRQELERQTMIFKYMMASIPVPPDLLLSFSKYPPSTLPSPGVEMRYGGNRGGGDPEPWRCRRTDGKKWRCSRDVAPDQKYCERHSHKGRPSRSRKPVEPPLSSSSTPSSSSSSSSLSLSSSSSSSLVSPSSVSTCNPIIFTPFAIPKPSSSSSFDLSSPSHHQFTPLPRYPDWFMKKEVAPTVSSCLFSQHIGDAGGDKTPTTTVDDHHQSCLLSRPFIDAWSLGDHVNPKDATNNNSNSNTNSGADDEHNGIATNNKCPAPSSPLNSILPLTLSMSAGIDSDYHRSSEDHTKANLEIRSSTSSHHHHHHHQPLNWMNSWISSPPGGPLAEALCLGMSGSGNGIVSSHSDDLVSPHGHSTGSSTSTLG